MAKPRRKIKSPIAKKGNLVLSDPPKFVKAKASAKAHKRSNNPSSGSKLKTAIKGCGASPLQPIR